MIAIKNEGIALSETELDYEIHGIEDPRIVKID
ncbi:hypothetical protein CJ739_2447 [Mariniflexile rhizosphaerae]|nr:hypothetical protein CJ739_2447 [Mariniflexile sp. TRM1-10]